jgi:hypothetical protein
MLRKKGKEEREKEEQILVEAPRLEAVENKLARVVGTLSLLQRQWYHPCQPKAFPA